MKNHTSFVLFPFSLTMIFASPEKPNFQDDIIPVFEQSCNSCHNPDKARGGLDLTSINAIVAGGSSGEVASQGIRQQSSISCPLGYRSLTCRHEETKSRSLN